MSLFVEETGTVGAPSIVFLHGVGVSGWMWWNQIAALSDFHCLNVDLPGHGKSVGVAWISLADTARQIAEIIQARATDGRAHMVGLSLGGQVALVLLETHAERVQSVILSGVTASPMPNQIFLKPQLWFMSNVMKRRWVADMQARALGLPPEQQKDFTENLQAMSIETYRVVLEEVMMYTVPPALRKVEVPTLVVAGGNESKIILQAVEDIPKILPNAQGRLAPGLKHGWNVEAPDLFSAMIRAWVYEKPLPNGLRSAASV